MPDFRRTPSRYGKFYRRCARWPIAWVVMSLLLPAFAPLQPSPQLKLSASVSVRTVSIRGKRAPTLLNEQSDIALESPQEAALPQAVMLDFRPPAEVSPASYHAEFCLHNRPPPDSL